jgi:hypothetical protein
MVGWVKYTLEGGGGTAIKQMHTLHRDAAQRLHTTVNANGWFLAENPPGVTMTTAIFTHILVVTSHSSGGLAPACGHEHFPAVRNGEHKGVTADC